MKVSKKQLKRIIKEEKKKLLNENGVGIGFANWSVNKSPDFAKAYGKDARVLHDFGSNSARQNRLKQEQNQVRQPWSPGQPSEDPGLSVDSDAYMDAVDDLDMELRNALAVAIDKGLIIDDLEDAWVNAMAFVEDLQRVE